MGDCLDHLRGKHGGSQFMELKNLGKFFPPWTITRDFWHAALQPCVSGIAVDVKLFQRSTGTPDRPAAEIKSRNGVASASS